MALDQEYLTSNRGIRYPFADDTVLPVEDSKSIVVFGCFIDAVVQLKSSYLDITPEITGISTNGNSLEFVLADRDAVHESKSIVCTKSRLRFPIVKGETSWCWYTFILSADGIKEYVEVNASDDPVGDISGCKLYLSNRCLGNEAHEVTSIQVYGGKGWNRAAGRRYTRKEAMALPPDAVVTGDVKVQTGYNVAFGSTTNYVSLAAIDSSNDIIINAIPGAGMGALPCDCEEGVVFKTPGLLSPDGHVRLFNDTCYDLMPTKESDLYSELKMHAKCKACCTCQMYVSIVNDRLVPLKDEILADKNSLDSTFNTYETNVAKWNERINNAFEDDIVITVTGTPLDAAGTDLKVGGNVTGFMNRCGFSIMVRNDSFVTVTFEFSDFSTNGEFFESQISYLDANLKPVITQLDLGRGGGGISVALPPGRSATFTSFIRLAKMVTTDEKTGFVANAKVTAKQGSRVIVSQVKGITI